MPARHAKVAITVIALVIGSVVPGLAQSSCRTNPDTAAGIVNGLKGAFEGGDTLYLRTAGKPFAVPANIALVTTSTTCKAGVTAYNKARALNGGRAIKSAYVVALSPNGYAVVNPNDVAGNFTIMFLFDNAWALKQRIRG